MIRITICGAAGRMGKAIIDLSNQQVDKNFIISGQILRTTTEAEMAKLCQQTDVLINFSSIDSIEQVTPIAAEYSCRQVIGVTGLTPGQEQIIHQYAQKTAILYAANYSIGANILAYFAEQMAKMMADFDIDLIDQHHNLKKDSPSGTAIMIATKVNNALGANKVRHHSIKAGGIIGTHELTFASNEEIISIKHQALTRSVFARGAIKAALWIANKDVGLYNMADML